MKNGLIVSHPEYGADVDDVFEEKEIIAWVKRFCYPEQVFSPAELAEWAEDNGFVKKQEE